MPFKNKFLRNLKTLSPSCVSLELLIIKILLKPRDQFDFMSLMTHYMCVNIYAYILFLKLI